MKNLMDFAAAVSSCLRQYATFEGRARRAEFWWFVLFSMLVQLAAATLDGQIGRGDGDFLQSVSTLALLLPSLAVGARRLHDTGRSAWWLLLSFVLIIGDLILLVWNCQRGTSGNNRFGPDPLIVAPHAIPVTPSPGVAP